MEMYQYNAPTWEDTLDSSVPLPQTLEEILLNRSCYTQACVERNRALIETIQKQLRVERTEKNAIMESWKNEVDRTVVQLKKQISEAFCRIQNLEESMKKQAIQRLSTRC